MIGCAQPNGLARLPEIAMPRRPATPCNQPTRHHRAMRAAIQRQKSAEDSKGDTLNGSAATEIAAISA
jgi:hypothetical protein